ncbi:uncharacterized protein LOC131658662 [Vicia villosa]|uniref:uncharacterized protein LOC131658662 n=1 Tax=Vicia villosa TaxID=3911 RepID=UPI00273B9CB8|nr:uncharacterized protein LOC131658662 [Vicia villosa]
MGGGFRLPHLVRRFLPEVQTADSKVSLPFREKIIYTVISLFIFLVYSLLPVHSTTDADPFYWMRAIVASKHGTLLALGITPIVTSEMLMVFLVGCNIIQDSNYNYIELIFLLYGSKNLLAILIALGQAVGYVLLGMHGSVGQFGVGNAVLIIMQLFFVGIIAKCLDQLLQKRYLSLFMATAICGNIIWQAFSPAIVNTGRGAEFEGSVIALFHLLITKTHKISALGEAFYRQNLPNLASLLATVIIILIVIYFQRCRLSKNAQGQQGSYSIMPSFILSPIMSIFLQSNLAFILYSISRLLYRKFSVNFTVSDYGIGHSIPSS